MGYKELKDFIIVTTCDATGFRVCAAGREKSEVDALKAYGLWHGLFDAGATIRTIFGGKPVIAALCIGEYPGYYLAEEIDSIAEFFGLDVEHLRSKTIERNI